MLDVKVKKKKRNCFIFPGIYHKNLVICQKQKNLQNLAILPPVQVCVPTQLWSKP